LSNAPLGHALFAFAGLRSARGVYNPSTQKKAPVAAAVCRNAGHSDSFGDHAVPLTLVAGLGHWLIGSVDWAIVGALLLGSPVGDLSR
jgi:hypothetical protein